MDPTLPSQPGAGRVVVLGGGIAGATAARALHESAFSVTVLDKGRGPGGRASTRRAGDLRFDHGAPYFTARSVRFAEEVGRWFQGGVVQRWVGAFGEVGPDGLSPLPHRNLWVGIPGMSRLVGAQLQGIDCGFGSRVLGFRRVDSRWFIECESGETLGPFEQCVIALPAPQATELLDPIHRVFAERVRGIVFAPCWSVMAACEESVHLGYDELRFRISGPIAKIIRDSAKPQRLSGGPEQWLLHASAAWSAEHLDAEPDRAAAALFAAFAGFLLDAGKKPSTPWYLRAHRWKYAQAVEPLGESCLHDPTQGLTVCGDWCLGSSIEHAWASGRAAAEALLSTRRT